MAFSDPRFILFHHSLDPCQRHYAVLISEPVRIPIKYFRCSTGLYFDKWLSKNDSIGRWGILRYQKVIQTSFFFLDHIRNWSLLALSMGSNIMNPCWSKPSSFQKPRRPSRLPSCKKCNWEAKWCLLVVLNSRYLLPIDKCRGVISMDCVLLSVLQLFSFFPLLDVKVVLW